MTVEFKSGELITLTEEGELTLRSSPATVFKKYPKAGEPLLYLKSESAQILHFRIAKTMEDDKQGGFRGVINMAKPQVEFKPGVKLFILYQDSVISFKFETEQVKTCLRRL